MNGYFNATERIPKNSVTGKRLRKPTHFCDNKKVQAILNELGKQPIVTTGRNGGTLLPIEVEGLFMAWLKLNGG